MGLGRKFVLPPTARAGLPPKRSEYDALARGNGLSPGLYARLPAGCGAGATGSFVSPQTSTSLSPARPSLPWCSTARTLVVVNAGKRTTFARRPVGLSGVRDGLGIAFQPLPSQDSRPNRAGGTTVVPSSRKYSFTVCTVRSIPKSMAIVSCAWGDPSHVQRLGGSRS